MLKHDSYEAVFTPHALGWPAGLHFDDVVYHKKSRKKTRIKACPYNVQIQQYFDVKLDQRKHSFI